MLSNLWQIFQFIIILPLLLLCITAPHIISSSYEEYLALIVLAFKWTLTYFTGILIWYWIKGEFRLWYLVLMGAVLVTLIIYHITGAWRPI